jgi:hypothetical protein
MRPPPVLLALATVLFGSCSLPAQPLPTSPLPVLGPLVDRWSPPAEARALLDSCRGARALPGVLAGLPASDRIVTLRAGLRRPHGPLAIACARRLAYDQLDAWESRRQVEVLLRAASEGGAWDELWDDFRFAMSCEDLPALLEALAAGRRGLGGAGLPKVHVYARAAHIPALCRAWLSESPRRRGVAVEALQVALLYTDRHRQTVAETLREVAGSPEGGEGPRPGLPPGLRQALRLIFLEEIPRVEALSLQMWCLRWLRDERPAREDLSLLESLLAADLDPFPHHQVLRALGRMQGPLPALPWPRLVPEDPLSARFALAARARLGDEKARRRLLEEAAGSALPFALLLDALPSEALALAAGSIERGESAALLDLLTEDETLEELLREHGLHWEPDALAPLVPAFLATDPGPHRLARALVALPGFRRPRVAAALLARLTEPVLRSLLAESSEEVLQEVLGEEALGVLEVLWPERLRAALRRLAASEHPELRDRSLGLLYRMGDPTSGAAILAWARRERPGEWEDLPLGPCSLPLLGRSAGPVVQAWIARHELIAAWAVALGAPTSAAEDLGACYETADRTARQAALAHLRAGRLGEAAVAVLPESPARDFPRLGGIRHPGIARWLREERRRRERSTYWWATGQLALQGDPEARAEVWHAVVRGQYMAMQDLGGIEVLSLGHAEEALRYWLSDLESNCCRVHTYGGCVPAELLASGEEIAWLPRFLTPLQQVARRYDPQRHRLRWSRLRAAYVSLPTP